MECLQFEKREKTGLLRINRPEALNALNLKVLGELHEFLTVGLRAENVRGLVVTGAGEKAFVAGADIKEMSALSTAGMLGFLELGQKVLNLLEGLPIPTIAAVNGFALGGGLELALACDFIYAAPTAKFGLPEVTLGLIPGFGGTLRLAKAVGARLAKELVFQGKRVDAAEAERIGLVNKVAAPEKLLEESFKTLDLICLNSSFAVGQAKRVINQGYDVPILEALEMEKQACTVCFAAEDRTEGFEAFLGKRKASFK